MNPFKILWTDSTGTAVYSYSYYQQYMIWFILRPRRVVQCVCSTTLECTTEVVAAPRKDLIYYYYCRPYIVFFSLHFRLCMNSTMAWSTRRGLTSGVDDGHDLIGVVLERRINAIP